MTKNAFASLVAAAVLLFVGSASAQPQFTSGDSPQWLKDRRYNEGIGVRAGEFELHPGIASEFGYDSNYYLRSDQGNVANGDPNAPILQALALRVTPSLYLSTLGPQRREGDPPSARPTLAFRAGINGSLRKFFELTSLTPAQSASNNNDIEKTYYWNLASDARLDILPERPVGGAVFANYSRAALVNSGSTNPDFAFDRDTIGAGGEVAVQPGGGTLDWRLGYQFSDVLFEHSAGAGFNSLTHEAFTRGRWKFRPRTSLVYDASLRFAHYLNQNAAHVNGVVDSAPLRARIGLNGLVTDRLAALALVGYGASFVDTSIGPTSQYDSVIGQAELKWFLAANPGISNSSELGLSLSSVAVGYTRDFQTSYLGNFYGVDRGYLKFYYFFAGRALATLEGGVGAIEYPNIWNLPAQVAGPAALRHASFTDVRADVTLFSEYRFTDAFGLNATLRYSQNISSERIPQIGQTEATCAAGSCFGMGWKRFEAYVGARLFL